MEAEGGASAFFMVERTRFGAPGLEGGGAGAVGSVQINGIEVDARRPHHLRGGDTIRLVTPGGGGYGDPVARDPALARRDAELGYLSDERAAPP